MKKLLSLIIAALMVLSALALTSCGGGSTEDLSDSKYVGTWKATSLEVMDESGEIEGDIILTLNGDGTGTLTGADNGEEETSELTWELTDDGFKTKGGAKMTFTDDGDNIKTNFFGVEMFFVRVD